MSGMLGDPGEFGSARGGVRSRLPREREQARRLVLRHRWYASGIATLISAALVFAGVGSPALADTATPPADTSEVAPADETAPAAPTPTEEAAEPPAETPPVEETPPAEEPPATDATPTPTPTEDPDATPSPEPTDPAAVDDPGLDQTDAEVDAEVDALGDIGVFAVPPPTATSAVITVKVGSDRTGITGVTPLAGVVLLLNNGVAGPNGVRPDGVAGTGDGWAKCTSDADGDCSFIVPETQAASGGNPAGVNRDARYWVVQSSVPAGYYSNPSLRTGGPTGAGTVTPYQFRTGLQLRANTTYSSQNANDFMLSSGTAATASGGIWQQSRVNPPKPASCGLDVALILDLSGSVGAAVPQLKAAANTFVDSLEGTPSRMALFSFSTISPADNATANFPNLTPVSTAAQGTAFKNLYAPWGAGGTTNWDRGLGVAASANNVANNFDLAVVITDGNPTSYNQPSQGNGSNNRLRETENGIFSANALKAGPGGSAATRVLAFGVGDGATGAANALNLRAISGPIAYNGTNGDVADYYQTADYAAVGTALRNLALGACQGTLTVTKQIVPNTAPPGTTTGAVAAGAGWQFTSTMNTAGVTTPTPSLTTTADGTGTVSYPLEFAGGVTTGSVTVTETQQPGFTLQPVAGQNAVCTNLNTGAAVIPTGNVANGFTVNVPSLAAVNCVVYNRAPAPEADITVTKEWVINGVPYANGAQPSDFTSQLQLTGPGAAGPTDQGWGVTRTGYAQNDTTTLSETVGVVDPTMCTNTAVVTSLNGGPVSIPLGTGYSMLLTQTSNTATITNNVTCESRLTLVKQIEGGTADPTSWTLNASFLANNPVPAGLPGFSGASGSPAATSQIITPNARYQLFETGGDPRYVQTDNRTNLQSNPLSTGSATCIRVDENGAPWPGSGFSDGINGGVNVPLGYRVACTFLNETASLTLLKNVVNDNGGSATAAAWDLTGTPAPLTGLTATTVDGSETAVPASTFQVRPNHVYTLTESSVPGYEFSRLQQFVGGVWVDVVANPDPALYPQQDGAGNWQVTVGTLDNPQYRFVNDDVAPILTLVKTVTNDNGGVALPSDWTLTATAPGGPDLSGASGTPAVTAQPVRAGVVYTIGETGGPAAYDWASLTCTGYPGTTRQAPTLTLQPGDNVTCTLNNDDILVPVTVEKADGVVAQLAGGIWTISYEVVVTNTSATLPTTYSLTDVPEFDASFTVLSQGWEGAPDVTDVPIEGGGTDTYTYVVTAEANETPVDPTALVCSPTSGGGFFNTATVTYPGGTDSDTACAVPAAPTVQKIAQTSVQDTATGAWTLSYEVEVSNPTAIPLSYILSDTAAPLPTGVTGGAWAASDPVPAGGGTFVRNVAWAGSGELATGTLPVGATHTYTISRTVMVAASVTDDALTCGSVVNQGGGFWNTATITNGIAATDSSDCAEIDRPSVTIEKTVTDTVQLDDGTWEITYDVVVTNPSTVAASVYSLSDALAFGGDIVVLDASWAGPTGTGPFAPDGTAILATDRVLGPDSDETYTVTAHATVDAAAWEGDTLTCLGGTVPAAGGFLNIATVTVNGTTIPADDCSEPALPTITKVGIAATQDAVDPSRWLVSYDVTVTSGGYDTFYSLSDTPAFPPGVTPVSGAAARTDIPGQPVVPITTGVDFVTDAALLAGEIHVYRVSWLVEIDDTADPDDADCTGQPGSGFFNTATLTVGAIPIDDSDCIPVVDRVYPTITKTVTSTNQDPATGDWTITYDIVVELAPTGPGNPEGLSAEYDLEDTLDFGGDIEIGSAEWSGQSSGDFPGPNDPATLATDEAIGAGETHTYTVTVVASVTAAAVGGGTTVCDSQPDGGGGFLNTAVLISGGQVTPVEACTEPVFPQIAKSAPGVATQDPATGDWTLTYQIAVTYPVTTVTPLPVVGYVLTDAPDLPTGVVLEGDWTATAATADTPAPGEPTWDGSGVWTIATAAFDPADDGITQHLYEITAVVSVTALPPGGIGTCDELPDEGIVVWNEATVTSGGYVDDDDACQVVQFTDVGILKETGGYDGPVESGEEFDYVLTVTNNGTGPANNVTVTDPVPARFTVTGIDLSGAPGWSNQNAPALVGAGNTVSLHTDTLAYGASVEIRFTVSVNAVSTPPVEDLGPDDPVPTLPELPPTTHLNEACVETPGDGDDSNDCSDVTVETKDITAIVYTRCVGDAPLIGFVLAKTPNLASEPVDFTWVPDSVTPTTSPTIVEETYPGGFTYYEVEFPWVGTEFTGSMVSIDYPGWRALQATDYGPGGGFINPADGIEYPPAVALAAGGFVFNGLILDPSELDYSWRFGTTVTLSVNPTMTYAVEYPAATETCFVARHTEVQIEKTASVERTDPGKSFTYDLAVENVSDDSAAEGVIVTDAIPADLRITDVSWPGEGDDTVFPNWESCAVSGQNAAGYGGTLECVLFGPLQPADSDNGGATSAPTITLAATVNPQSTASVITNVAFVDYHTFGDPEDPGRDSDDATVLLSSLPATGGNTLLSFALMGLLAMLGGAAVLMVVRRRRGETQPAP